MREKFGNEICVDNNDEYKYRFSIITAVYNVEDYLEETVQSIINQSIGFKNIQLILVDDGSTDNSGKLCDEFAEKYPDNIFAIHKENGGVSSARNLGLDAVKGKYVNFIDSDDKWEEKALEYIWKFFEENYDEIDVVATPLTLFEGRTGEHILNYKFDKGTRVVDLEQEWNIFQMSAASAFVKAKCLKNLRFDTQLKYAEDSKLIQSVLLEKEALGLVKEAKYFYRIRSGETSSAIQNSTQNPAWYMPVINRFHLDLIDLVVDEETPLPRFLQMALMYDLQWRIKQAQIPNDILTEEEKSIYFSSIKKILSYIDDVVILAQRQLTGANKVFAMQLKYTFSPRLIKTKNDYLACFSLYSRFSIVNSIVKFEFITIENNILKIKGNLETYNFPYKEFRLSFYLNGKKVPTKVKTREDAIVCLEKKVTVRYDFYADIKLDSKSDVNELKIGARINGKLVYFMKFGYGYFAPITSGYRFSHYNKDGWVVTAYRGKIKIAKEKPVKEFFQEVKFLLWGFKNNYCNSRKNVFLRLEYHLRKLFKRKPVWVISDRPNVAGDNGEAFFRYVTENHPEINARFVIEKDCPDFERMKKVGPVLVKGSRKHKLYVLISDYIFSSQGENEHFDPFGRERNVFRNILVSKPFVFLQHGVIEYDLSGWLNKNNKNIFGFITTSKNEYESILKYDYGYTKKNVWLTGLPRFDRLYDKNSKIVTLMPTWRKYLTKRYNPETGNWELVSDFKESDYFDFYNSLLNHPKLVEALKKYGYKIQLLLHPNLRGSAEMFDSNDVAKIISGNVSYTDVYAESSLVLTDYSSAVFDFAYLRKPLIYTQFDREEFSSGGHTSSGGYFRYEYDGFGEIEEDVDSAVNRIIEYLENDCTLKDVYRKRIDRFFAYDDKNNCQRIFDKVMASKK